MQPKQIFITTESRMTYNMLEIFLGRKSEIVHASSGEEALQYLDTIPDIDLILLDNDMSEMSGLDCLASIKENPVFKHIPVILIAKEQSEEDATKGVEAGASAYIKIPFKAPELLSIIEKL